MKKTPFLNYIDGQWAKGRGAEFTSLDPATLESVSKGNSSVKEDVDNAVFSAQKTFPLWSQISLEERISHLKAYAAVLKKQQHQLAETISIEMGKPLWESLSEVSSMIAKVGISIEAQQVRCPTVRKEIGKSTLNTRHKPHGVMAVFGPFNFPAHLPNGHIVPALLAGNTVVFKPSELTPVVAHEMVALWDASGLPKGVLNLVQGGKETGKLLSSHPDINGLLFTGSWETGKILSHLFADTPEKILALEMGGNNPLVVWDVENIRAAAYLTILSSYLSAGQRCTCARRLIIPSSPIGDQLIEHILSMVAHIKIGPYNSPSEPFMGPLVSPEAAAHVIEKQSQLQRLGGEIVLESKRLSEKSAFVTPGIIDVTEVNSPPDEEIFGPFIQVKRVNSFEMAIEEANKTKYGLVAGLLSDDEEKYKEYYRNVHAGLINWNTQTTGASSEAPFGGVGRSGNHRPSAYYAADYCNTPIASMEMNRLELPLKPNPGILYTEGHTHEL